MEIVVEVRLFLMPDEEGVVSIVREPPAGSERHTCPPCNTARVCLLRREDWGKSKAVC